jgi:hypothetical protein
MIHRVICMSKDPAPRKSIFDGFAAIFLSLCLLQSSFASAIQVFQFSPSVVLADKSLFNESALNPRDTEFPFSNMSRTVVASTFSRIASQVLAKTISQRIGGYIGGSTRGNRAIEAHGGYIFAGVSDNQPLGLVAVTAASLNKSRAIDAGHFSIEGHYNSPPLPAGRSLMSWVRPWVLALMSVLTLHGQIGPPSVSFQVAPAGSRAVPTLHSVDAMIDTSQSRPRGEAFDLYKLQTPAPLSVYYAHFSSRQAMLLTLVRTAAWYDAKLTQHHVYKDPNEMIEAMGDIAQHIGGTHYTLSQLVEIYNLYVSLAQSGQPMAFSYDERQLFEKFENLGLIVPTETVQFKAFSLKKYRVVIPTSLVSGYFSEKTDANESGGISKHELRHAMMQISDAINDAAAIRAAVPQSELNEYRAHLSEIGYAVNDPNFLEEFICYAGDLDSNMPGLSTSTRRQLAAEIERMERKFFPFILGETAKVTQPQATQELPSVNNPSSDENRVFHNPMYDSHDAELIGFDHMMRVTQSAPQTNKYFDIHSLEGKLPLFYVNFASHELFISSLIRTIAAVDIAETRDQGVMTPDQIRASVGSKLFSSVHAAEYSVDEIIKSYNEAINAMFQGKQVGISSDELRLLQSLHDQGFIAAIETVATSQGQFPVYRVVKPATFVFAARATDDDDMVTKTRRELAGITRMAAAKNSAAYFSGIRALWSSLTTSEKSVLGKKVGFEPSQMGLDEYAIFAGHLSVGDFNQTLPSNRVLELQEKLETLESEQFPFVVQTMMPKGITIPPAREKAKGETVNSPKDVSAFFLVLLITSIINPSLGALFAAIFGPIVAVRLLHPEWLENPILRLREWLAIHRVASPNSRRLNFGYFSIHFKAIRAARAHSIKSNLAEIASAA